jgi:branched-subunit amino acid ABC-type transport system permease component
MPTDMKSSPAACGVASAKSKALATISLFRRLIIFVFAALTATGCGVEFGSVTTDTSMSEMLGIGDGSEALSVTASNRTVLPAAAGILIDLSGAANSLRGVNPAR